MSMWQIGEVSVQRVLEFEEFLLSPAVLLPQSTPAALDLHRHWLEPKFLDPISGLLQLAFHSFAVRSRGLIIVVDTCGGNDKQRPQKPRYHMNDYPYLDRLHAAGIDPGMVDYVLCTHLHADHVGWNTRLVNGRWVPTFPNAKHLFSKAEWDYWKDTENRERYTEDPFFEDSVLPVFEAGLAVLVDGEFAFTDDVCLMPTPGHTPGHVCLDIQSRGERAILSGDLMHHPVQCNFPQWNSCFCVDPEYSRRTRLEFVEQFGDSGALILPAHFPTPTAGHIVRIDAQWHFEFEQG